MAQLQNTGVTGSLIITGSTLNLPFLTDAQTGSFTTQVGAIWFNSTTNRINYVQLAGWSTGNSLNTGRQWLAGSGTPVAALAIAGNPLASPTLTYTNATEAYNGSSWSAGGNTIIIKAFSSAAGTQTATINLMFKNSANAIIATTETYNGSSWATSATMITGRFWGAATGTTSATIAFSGNAAPPGASYLQCTETYNGTSWTAGGAKINPMFMAAAAGTTTAALSMAGYNAPGVARACTEIYNGSAWSAGNPLITARRAHAGNGSTSAAIAFGGQNPTTLASAELYNGSTWSSTNNMNAGRYALAGAISGTSGNTLAFGGYCGAPSGQRCTEQYATVVSV